MQCARSVEQECIAWSIIYAKLGTGEEMGKRSPAEKIDVRIIALIICGRTGIFRRVNAATYGERAAATEYSIQLIYCCRLTIPPGCPSLIAAFNVGSLYGTSYEDHSSATSKSGGRAILTIPTASEPNTKNKIRRTKTVRKALGLCTWIINIKPCHRAEQPT